MNESLKDTIIPKSDQLNADDLLTGAQTFTITKVTRGDSDQPINVHLREHPQPWKPCKSMRRVLIAIWGDKGSDWVNKTLILFNDPTVKWGGVEVGGIRISHMEGLEEATNLTLTETRGKRKPYKILPLEALPPYPEDRFDKNLDKWKAAIAEGKYTTQDIIQGCAKVGVLTEDQITTIQGLAQ